MPKNNDLNINNNQSYKSELINSQIFPDVNDLKHIKNFENEEIIIDVDLNENFLIYSTNVY